MNVLERCTRRGWLAVAVAVSLWGCGVTDEQEAVLGGAGGAEESLGEVSSELNRAPLPFDEFADPNGVGSRAKGEARAVIASSAAYQRYFGHPAPKAVDFAGGDVVIFYTVGTKPTGGYDANILKVSKSKSGKTLYVTTESVSPGKSCIVTQAFTTPYVLAKVRLTKRPSYASFTRTARVNDCSQPVSPCATVLCKPGMVCELQEIQCITTPCDPIPVCVPAEPEPGPCATVRCAAGYECVEKKVECVTTPCDPVAVCEPVAPPPSPCDTVRCAAGHQCVEQKVECVTTPCDPVAVCEPIPAGPCATTLCAPGNVCVEKPSDCGGANCPLIASCEPDAPSACAATTCPAGSYCKELKVECVTLPCDPLAICIKEGPFCGGIAGLTCPGAGQCKDAPNDGCDPKRGGADCGGVCECPLIAACAAGTVWDSDPNVCKCVKM